MKNPAIILVTPQLGENIGSVARVMSNFNFSDLRIVNPREEWPNHKAVTMASNAAYILEQAKIYVNLGEALSGIKHIYACSARERKMNKENYSVREHISDINNKNISSSIGIMFGSERCGLLNDEIIMAKKIINIPSSDNYSSLNLSHAVGVICYEYFVQNNSRKISDNIGQLADGSEIEYLVNYLDECLTETNFYKDSDRRNIMIRNIANIFSRNSLTKQEIKTLLGMTKSLFNYRR